MCVINERSGGNAFSLSDDIVDYSSQDGAVSSGIKLPREGLSWPTTSKEDKYAAKIAITALDWAQTATETLWKKPTSGETHGTNGRFYRGLVCGICVAERCA